ncbi:hypothetical protein HBH70_230030 [Parastagonospora nodorum]|nr:hypothetical protein HBH52_215670 [Parastagonospora nodorum]KAH4152086.1 hypothetical protein HBH43_236120 [Parastagonospora nodorum]KAH4193764.1 hypothetical protein HBH42_105080 [Parastagonospora nodorum]KAH4956721.1 hypothetical protein HBI78_200340 [Parastagonospora nodorum]KAH4975030.1 hypothetical protein HBI77_231380 [Parastagonospora nodorum]
MEKWPIVLLILPLIICLGHLASLRETGFKHIETRDYPASIAEEQPSALFELRCNLSPRCRSCRTLSSRVGRADSHHREHISPRVARHNLYPDGELVQAPIATPLSGPRLISPTPDEIEFCDEKWRSSSTTSMHPCAAEQRRKHESYTLAGSVFLITGNGKTLNLPAPSDSPADPLSWSKWKRAGVALAVGWFSIVALAVAQAAGIFLRVISHEFNIDNIQAWQMDTLVTMPTLFMAVGSFLWIPLTIGMGRRPVFLIASVTLIVACIGAGYSQSFPQLLACICFLGLAEGFALTAALLIVIDMTFIHERPRAIAMLWSIAGFFGTGLVAIIPYISDEGTQWRSYYRYWSIPAMISFFLTFFLFPETYFKRPTVAFDGLIVLQSSTEKTTVFKDIEVDSDIYRDLPELPTQNGILGRYSVWISPFASWTAMVRCYPQIGFCLINPMIFWMAIAVAVNYAAMLFIGASYPRVLGEAPYNLRTELVVLVNLASAVGGLLALGAVQPVNRILDHLAKRNRGVREAEHYLLVLILPVITGAASSLIYGCAVHYSLHLSLYYFAYGLNGFSWVTIAIGTTMWVTEAFPRWAAPALAAMSGTSFLVSFGLSFGLSPWIIAHGYRLVGVELAVFQIFTGLVVVPISFWGKSARQAIHGRWADERGGALRPL